MAERARTDAGLDRIEVCCLPGDRGGLQTRAIGGPAVPFSNTVGIGGFVAVVVATRAGATSRPLPLTPTLVDVVCAAPVLLFLALAAVDMRRGSAWVFEGVEAGTPGSLAERHRRVSGAESVAVGRSRLVTWSVLGAMMLSARIYGGVSTARAEARSQEVGRGPGRARLAGPDGWSAAAEPRCGASAPFPMRWMEGSRVHRTDRSLELPMPEVRCVLPLADPEGAVVVTFVPEDSAGNALWGEYFRRGSAAERRAAEEQAFDSWTSEARRGGARRGRVEAQIVSCSVDGHARLAARGETRLTVYGPDNTGVRLRGAWSTRDDSATVFIEAAVEAERPADPCPPAAR